MLYERSAGGSIIISSLVRHKNLKFSIVCAWREQIVRKEGIATLWRGVDVTLMTAVPMVGIYLPLYESLNQSFKPNLGPEVCFDLPHARSKYSNWYNFVE